mmetsp:Transcript_109702/g.318895  ORF Transcript_109702/g.318895 Transcript_109702/m.318895 type:complete len:245 (-) Transcript_109702:348-1082(-)
MATHNTRSQQIIFRRTPLSIMTTTRSADGPADSLHSELWIRFRCAASLLESSSRRSRSRTWRSLRLASACMSTCKSETSSAYLASLCSKSTCSCATCHNKAMGTGLRIVRCCTSLPGSPCAALADTMLCRREETLIIASARSLRKTPVVVTLIVCRLVLACTRSGISRGVYNKFGPPPPWPQMWSLACMCIRMSTGHLDDFFWLLASFSSWRRDIVDILQRFDGLRPNCLCLSTLEFGTAGAEE